MDRSNSNLYKDHIPVLLKESIEGLNIKPDGIYVDATLGRGGHSSNILRKLGSKGHLYSFDQDMEAIEASEQILSSISPHYTLIHSNFRNLKERLNSFGIESVDGILFDLGVSSPQFDQEDRGFSYHYDSPLDMRMDKTNSVTAALLVNELSEFELQDIFFKYGEEKFSKKIADRICYVRKTKPITTTKELADIVKSVIPPSLRQESHPAKRVFQALRIVVNDELKALEEGLEQALSMLNKGGRICVISFHSLEDRIVKEMFKEKGEKEKWTRNMPISFTTSEIDFDIITKKPITPHENELLDNPRSASSKLRIIEKI